MEELGQVFLSMETERIRRSTAAALRLHGYGGGATRPGFRRWRRGFARVRRAGGAQGYGPL
jgi:hypothetical protein